MSPYRALSVTGLFWAGLVLPVLLASCSSGAMSSPAPTAAALPTLSATPTVAVSVPPCVLASSQGVLRQINPLVPFLPHDGYADPSGCKVWLVGEEVAPREKAVVMYSEDGGQKVQELATLPQAFRLWGLRVVQNTTLWVAGESKASRGFLAQSADRGQSWKEIPLPSQMRAAMALAFSGNQLWVAGNTDNDALALRSSDGGRTWQEAVRVPPKSQRAYFKAMAVSGETVILVGDDSGEGVVVMSRDGGQTFERFTGWGQFTAATSVALADASHAYVGGWYDPHGHMENAVATLFQTADSGKNWKSVPLPPQAVAVVDLAFLSPTQAYAVMAGGGIYRVTVGGDNAFSWEPLPPVEPKPDLGGPNRFILSGGEALFAFGTNGGGLYYMKP